MLTGVENTYPGPKTPSAEVMGVWGSTSGQIDWTEVTSMVTNSPRLCSQQTGSLQTLTLPAGLWEGRPSETRQ